jgi:hypothetical protein
MIDTGMIASEGAYADNCDGDGIVRLQILDCRLKNEERRKTKKDARFRQRNLQSEFFNLQSAI